MNGKINTTINTLPPFKYFIHSIGELPSSYLESMSYYETLVWLCNYLKETIIPTVNNTGNAVTELQNLYINLQNYVNDYFDNLDVQEEINNKLDDMAESGELTSLIKRYVDPIINEFKDNITEELNEQTEYLNGVISEQNVRISAVTSGSPLKASSTSGMTDHNRIYVNTTDGNWYYYNGSAWTIGGVYQSTQLENFSVGINKLDNKLNGDLYTKLNADTMIWGNYSLVNGVYEGSTKAYTSQLVYVSKGTIINISNLFKGRITIFDFQKNYVSNTGGFVKMENYEVPLDCYIAISIWKIDESTASLSDCNSQNVTIQGFINKRNKLIDSLVFSKNKWATGSYNGDYVSATNEISTNKIFVKAGTIIGLNDYKWMDYIIDYFDLDYNIVELGSTWLNEDTIIENDCLIDIRMQSNKKSTIPDVWMSNIKNLIKIESKYIDILEIINSSILKTNNQIESLSSPIENGTFGYTDGRLVDSTTRVRTSDIIKFNKGDIILPVENYQMKLYFYNSDGSYIGYTGTDWFNNYEFTNDSFTRLTFRRIDNTSISYDQLPQYLVFRKNTIIPVNRKEFSYIGDKIELNNTCDCRFLRKLPTTGTTGSAQGMAYTNNLLFLLYNTGGISCFELSEINNNTILGQTAVATGTIGSSDPHQHVNNACFGNKLNSDDEFPLLYTSGGLWTSDSRGYCAVDTIEIDEELGTITSTNVQKIYIDQSGFEAHGFSTFYAFPSFTTDGNYLYTATGKTIANTWNNPDNKHVITKFRLPNPSEGDVTLTYEDIINQVENEFNVIKTQGGTCGAGYIIQLYGNVPQTSFPTVLNFYDQVTLQLKNIINCKDMAVAGAEPEDLVVFNNKILIRRVDNNIYELTF